MDLDFKWRVFCLLQALSEELRVLPWCIPVSTTESCFNSQLWKARNTLDRLHFPIWGFKQERKLWAGITFIQSESLLCDVIIPPENSVVNGPACKCQQTFPEWKVWLIAMMETDFIFRPTPAKSNFQLILPSEEPSVRARYTWGKGKFHCVKKKTTKKTTKSNHPCQLQL